MKRRTGLLKIACLISLGAAAAGAVNVGALSYQSNVGVGFTFEPTLNVTLSSADLTISDLTPNSGAKDSNIITVGVSTNAAYGYNLLATAGNATNATTNLVNGNNSFAALSSNVENLAEFTNNTWGYSYCITNCDTASNWVSGSQGSTSEGYAGLPLYTGTGVQLTGVNDKTSSSAQFKIAAKAGATQASGEYTNVVNFTAVSKVGVVTLLDAFVASGATQQNGYYTMQSMTPGICSAAAVGSSVQLLDVRDNKVYWVTKLADNNCWMTQNLALDLAAGVALTSDTTDLNDNSQSGAYAAGYEFDGTTLSWKPANGTKSFSGTSISGWTHSNTAPSSAKKTDGVLSGQTATGNYYNWTAAIASNNSTNYNSSTYDNVGYNPRNSICSKGWRLPTISSVVAKNDFSNLNNSYNGGSTVSDAGLLVAPLWFVRSGYVDYGALYGYDTIGVYWSSTVFNSNYAYHLGLTDGRVNPDNNNYRYYGRSVRCLARSE